MEKVFLINKHKTELTLQDLNTRPVSDLISLADFIIPASEAVNCLTGLKQLDQVSNIISMSKTTSPKVQIDDYMFITGTIDTDEIGLVLHNEDCKDILINKELEVHIRRNETGYSFDFYKHASESDMEDDDYDFDGDFIKGYVVCDDELDNSEIVEVHTISTDGSDREAKEQWYLSGLRLTSTFNTYIVEDEDDLIDRIINDTHDTVTCITLNGNTIYEY